MTKKNVIEINVLDYGRQLALAMREGSVDAFIDRLTELPEDSLNQLGELLHLCILNQREPDARKTINSLLDLHPSWIESYNEEGHTPLHVAVSEQKHDIIDLLIERGADPRTKTNNEDREDALQFSCLFSMNHRLQEALVEAVIDPYNPDAKEKSWFLAYACINGNLGATRAFLRRGADFSVTIETEPGGPQVGNALSAACYAPLDESPTSPKIVSLLLSSAQCTSEAINDGWNFDNSAPERSPLHFASANGNIPCMRQLIEKGAWVDVPENLGIDVAVTPLMKAAWAASREAIELLLLAGAKVDRRDFRGRTALHYLAVGDCLSDDEIQWAKPCLEILLASGSDPKVLDHDGNTAADLAKKQGQMQLAAEIESALLNDTAQPRAKARPVKRL